MKYLTNKQQNCKST